MLRAVVQPNLQLYDILSLRSAIALNHVKLNPLAFVQRLVSVAHDCAKVYEYVVSAFHLDKTEAFLRVKPLYCSGFHGITSKFNFYVNFFKKQKNSHIGKGAIVQ
mgnify:CR=1 FL=1